MRPVSALFFAWFATAVSASAVGPGEGLAGRYLDEAEAGRSLLDQGRAGEALGHLLNAHGMAPYAVHLPATLVSHEHRDDLIMKAREAASGPGGARAHLLLGAIEPDPRDRLAHRRAAARADPGNGFLQVLKGVACLRVSLMPPGDLTGIGTPAELEKEALEAFLAAHRVDPTDDRSFEGLVVWIPGRGPLYRLYPGMIPADVTSLTLPFHLLHCALGRQSPDDPLSREEASDLVQKSLAVIGEATDLAARNLVGIIENHLGHYERAVALLHDVVRAPGAGFLPRFTLGRALLDSNHVPEAAEVFERLSRDYVEPGLSHNMGLVRERQGDGTAARVSYLQALLLNPESIPSRHNLAACWVRAGQIEDARGLVDRGLEQVPGDTGLQALQGILLASAGEVSRALPILKRCSQEATLSDTGIFAMAACEASTAQWEACREHLSELINTDPLNPRYHRMYRECLNGLVSRAAGYLEAGDDARATEIIQDVLRDFLVDAALEARVTGLVTRAASRPKVPAIRRASR